MDIIIIIRSDNKTSGWLHFLNLEVRRVNVLQVREVLDDIVEFRIVFSSHKVVYELICFWHSALGEVHHHLILLLVVRVKLLEAIFTGEAHLVLTLNLNALLLVV